MLWEAIAVGTMAWWLIIAIFFVLLWIEIHYEHPIFAFTTFCLMLAFLSTLTGFKLHWLEWLIGHWDAALLFAVAYVMWSPGWGRIKWKFFYVPDRLDEYNEGREGMRASYESGNWKNSYKDYKEYLADRFDFPPQPRKNKARIINWMAWWPFSMIDTALTDFLYRAWEAIYNRIAVSLWEDAKEAFKGFEELK